MFVSPNDRSLRKRVFYSLYTLDRILSAEFGIPIMLSDTDIDTCLPGDSEKHDEGEMDVVHPARTPVEGVAHDASDGVSKTQKRKRRDTDDLTSTSRLPASGSEISRTSHQSPNTTNSRPQNEENEPARRRLLAANALIQMAKMIGRAMELFNTNP